MSAGFHAVTIKRRLSGLVLRVSTTSSNLIDAASVRRCPGSPLLTVDWPEIAVLVCPVVPDGDPVGFQIFGVGVALKEPDQLVDDRLEMQLLGGDQGKALGQVEPHLMTEHAERAGAGAVGLAHALRAHAAHEVEILLHRAYLGDSAPNPNPPVRASGGRGQVHEPEGEHDQRVVDRVAEDRDPQAARSPQQPGEK